MAISTPQNLPQFSLPGMVACPMCGSAHIKMEFRPYGVCLHNGSDDEISTNVANPRMHRECELCGCTWDERTLSNSPDTLAERAKRKDRYGKPLPDLLPDDAS
jgi:hypothetical protein